MAVVLIDRKSPAAAQFFATLIGRANFSRVARSRGLGWLDLDELALDPPLVRRAEEVALLRSAVVIGAADRTTLVRR